MVVSLVRNCAFGALVNLVKVFLGAINCANTSLSEESASTKLYSTSAKSIFSLAAWLLCWNTACVAFKYFFSLKLLL